MKQVFIFHFVLLVLFYLSTVQAKGQMFLDNINPVKDTTVHFNDHVETSDAVFTTLTTENFELLKQYELHIEVPDIAINSGDYFEFYGQLGTAVSSLNGDIVVNAPLIAFDGHGLDIDALQTFSATSTTGDFYSSSDEDTSVVAGGVNLKATGNSGVSISSAADVDISTTDDLFIFSRQFNVNNTGDFNFNADEGEFTASAGTRATLQSKDQLEVTGILGVSYLTSGSFVVSAEEAFFFSAAVSNLAMTNIAVTFSTMNVVAEEDIKFSGRQINVTSLLGNLYLNAIYQYADVKLRTGNDLNLQALSTLSLVSEGEAGAVNFISANGEFSLDAITFTAFTESDLYLGNGYTTLDVTFTSSQSSVVANTHTTTVYAGTGVNFDAGSDLSFNNDGDVAFESASGKAFAENQMLFSNKNFYFYSDIGEGAVDIETVNSNIELDANNRAFFETFYFSSYFREEQILTAGDEFHIVSFSDNIHLYAEDTLTLSAQNDFTAAATNILWFSNGNQTFTTDANIEFDIRDTANIISQGKASGSVKFYSTGETDILTTSDIDILANTFEINTGSISFSSDETYFNSGYSQTFTGATDLNFYVDNDYTGEVGDIFSIESDDYTLLSQTDIYFKSSTISFTSDAGFTSNGNWVGKFGYLSLDFSGSVEISASDVSFVTGADFNLLSTPGPIDFESQVYVSESEEETHFDVNTFTASVDTYAMKSNDDIIFNSINTAIRSGSNEFNTDSFNIDASQSFVTTAGSISLTSAYDTSIVAGDLATLTLQSTTGSMTFQTPATPFTYSIESVFGNVNWKGNYSIDSAGTVDILSHGFEYYSNDFTVGAAGYIVNYAENVNILGNGVYTSGQVSSFITGKDDFFYMFVNSTGPSKITFESDQGDIIITGEGDVKFESSFSISTLSTYETTFKVRYGVTVSAASDLSITALSDEESGEFSIDSADSINFINYNDFDIRMTSNENLISYEYSRDFEINSHGVDNFTECGILISASVQAASTHEYHTNDYMNIFADHCVDIRSFYTGLGPSGDISVTSSGGSFWKSYNSGVTFLSNGVGTTNGALNLISNNYNVEIQATNAAVHIWGDQGVTFTDGRSFDAFGLRGVTILSTGLDSNIDFITTDNTRFSGDRGLTFAAGTDAPFYAGHYTITSDNLLVMESNNNLLFRSFSYLTGGQTNAMTIRSADTVTVEGNDGSGINFSASADAHVIATNTLSIIGEDGLVRIDADIGDFNVTASTSISWTTGDGPVGVEGRGSGGSITTNTNTYSSTSYLSTHISALGTGIIDTESNLYLLATGAYGCVQVQTERAYDDVNLNAQTSINVEITGAANFEDDQTLFAGNNVDIDAVDGLTFTVTDLFEIGADSTPVVRVVAGGAGSAGVSIAFEGDIDLNSNSTITSISTGNTEFQASNMNVTSKGPVYFLAQGVSGGTDVDLTITGGDNLVFTAYDLVHLSPGLYSVATEGSISVVQTGVDLGDRIDIDSIGALDYTALNDATTYTPDYYLQANQVDVEAELSYLDFTFMYANELNNGTFDPYDFAAFIDNAAQNETKEGDIRFISSNDVILDSENFNFYAADSLEFEVGNDLDFTTIDFNIHSTGSLVLGGSSYTINADNAVYTASGNAGPIDNSILQSFYPHSGEMHFTAGSDINIFPQDSLVTITSTNQDVKFLSYGTLSYGTVEDFNLAVTNANPINTLISINDRSTTPLTVAVAGNWNWFDNFGSLINVTAIGERLSYTIQAAESLSWGADTSYTVTSDESITLEGQTINAASAVAGSLLTFTAATTSEGIHVETHGPPSNILLTGEGTTFDMTYNLGYFLGTDGVLVDGDVTVDDQSSSYKTTVGTMMFEGTTSLVIDMSDNINFISRAYNDGRDAGIYLSPFNIDLTAVGDVYYQGFDLTEFRSEGVVTFSLSSTFNVATTNFGSNIVFHTYDGDITFTVPQVDSIGVLHSIYAVHDTFTATTITVQSVQSNVFIQVNNEEGPNNFVIFDATEDWVQNAANFIVYKTGDQNPWESLIEVQTSTGSISYVSLLADTPPLFSLIPGITIQSDEFGILFTGDELTVDATNVFVDSDSSAFTGSSTTASATIDSGADVYFTNGGDFNILSTTTDSNFNANLDITFISRGDSTDDTIVMTFEDNQIISGTATDIFFQSNGMDSDIFIVDDSTQNSGSLTYTATGSATFTADAGIRFMVTNRVDGTDVNPYIVTNHNILTVIAEDWEDSIFMQSDFWFTFDIEGSGQGDEINQRTYNHRLGFFSKTPAHIQYVSVNHDPCLGIAFCEANASTDNYYNGINGIDNAVTELQQRLIDFGLIEWHYPINNEVAVPG